MKTQSIEVTIPPTGEVRVEALGFAGAACEKATAFIEQALGRSTARVRKPSYYLKEKTRSNRRQKLGGGG